MSTVFTKRIASSSDDCMVNYTTEAGGSWFLSLTQNNEAVGVGSAVDPYQDKYGSGLRFLDVTIPQGASIITAYITFIARGDAVTVVKSRFSGEDTDDAATFSDFTNYKNRRGIDGGTDNTTTAKVDWDSIPAWTADTSYDSPELKTIIQEIVNRSGWASGNDLVVFWDDHDDRSDNKNGCGRRAYSYNGSTTYAPLLYIEYTSPTLTQKTVLDTAALVASLGASRVFKSVVASPVLGDSISTKFTSVLLADYYKILSESLPIVDSISTTATQIYMRTLGEVMSIVESVSKAIDIKRTVAEVIQLVENLGIWSDVSQLISDIVETGEAVAKTVTKTITNSLSVVDSAARLTRRSVASSISLIWGLGLSKIAYIPNLTKLAMIDNLTVIATAKVPALTKLILTDIISIIATALSPVFTRDEIDVRLSTEPYLDIALTIEGGGNK